MSRKITLSVPSAARAVTMVSTGSLATAIIEDVAPENPVKLGALVVLCVASMAYDIADRRLRRSSA